MNNIIDLHIHTNCSDGVLTPSQVIDEAKNNGLSTISITDHDTVEAYTQDLVEYATKNGINLIKGIEISTKTNKCGIHILGYDIDVHNQEFNTKLYKLRNARHDYLYKVSTKLKELGYIINTEELDKIDAVTKAHISLDIINNNDNQDILIDNFGQIPTKGEFIESIMNEGCPAYVKKETVTPKEAAELIRIAGGKVVLAHPVAYTYEDNLSTSDIQELIDDINPDGIEAYYIYVDKDNIKHNDIDKWLEIAKKNKKWVTIGSDFHNKDGIHPGIGLLGEDINLSPREIDQIVNNILK